MSSAGRPAADCEGHAIAAVLFAIALTLDIADTTPRPMEVLAFIAAGLLRLVLQLAGVATSSAKSGWRSRR